MTGDRRRRLRSLLGGRGVVGILFLRLRLAEHIADGLGEIASDAVPPDIGRLADLALTMGPSESSFLPTADV